MIVGLGSSSLGFGGGIFMIPAFLTFIPSMDPHTAKGTSLLVITFVALVNIWRMYDRQHGVQWKLAGYIAAGSVAGGILGAWVTGFMSRSLVLWCFFSVLLLIAVRTFLIRVQPVGEEEIRERKTAATLIGLITGIVSGATGIGGGAVLIPLVLMAEICSNRRIVALSNTVMTATCAAGTLTHMLQPKTVDLPWTIGHVNLVLVPLVFLGAQLGAHYGKFINARISPRQRKITMGILLLLIAIRIGHRALQESGYL